MSHRLLSSGQPEKAQAIWAQGAQDHAGTQAGKVFSHAAGLSLAELGPFVQSETADMQALGHLAAPPQPKQQVVGNNLVTMHPDGTASASPISGIESAPITPYQQAQLDARAADLEMEREKMELRERELSATASKALIDAQNEYDARTAYAGKALQLADDYSRLKPEGGVGGQFDEFLKSVTGSQDEVSLLKTEMRQLKNKLALADLPPGVASDKDVELAMSGYPDDKWSADQVESWLRGMAKLAKTDAARSLYRSQYISANSHTKNMLTRWRAPVHSETLGKNISLSEIYYAALDEGVPVVQVLSDMGVKDEKVLKVLGL